ncbi:hypothetical protein MES5069_200080 [Mesorhizobium escarrei]|uniref:Uncharacterized protein n=1 Tax=Mesorhizobium escarrei TaxID=666018 RepID=A0ABM9DPJ0_9HYPH|nr:hypothetical protein MES5069_200080 [Mesorhizobium escarrei]
MPDGDRGSCRKHSSTEALETCGHRICELLRVDEAEHVGDPVLRSVKISVLVGMAALVASFVWFQGCDPRIAETDRPYDATEAEKASIAGYGEIRMYRDARIAAGGVRDWTPATEPDGLDVLMISGGGVGRRLQCRRAFGVECGRDPPAIRCSHRREHWRPDRAIRVPRIGS